MSKIYKGKTCVYCATEESTCSDHVIAREFFPSDMRNYLPKVSSCDACNNKKAKLEHYATSILPFGSMHENAEEMLRGATARRLERNIKLKKELKNNMQRIWLKSKSNLILPTITIPINGDILTQLFSMIIRGLYYHNWQMIIPRDYFVEVYTLTLRGLLLFREMMISKAPSNYIQKKLGNGIFHYSCTRGDKEPGISAWEMYFYNGVMIAGEKNELVYFCGLTGPEAIRRTNRCLK
ncbi:MAG: hypothetical protein WA277_01305 [Nitrospirota bacterium]